MANVDQTNKREVVPQAPLLVPTLKIGAVCGGAAGIIRSSTPGLFAIASGLQWALLGSTYYATRGAICRAWLITASTPPQERVLPSTLAGSFTGGTIGGLLRGRSNIIPGIIMFSLFGFAGQHAYNALDARQASNAIAAPSDIAAQTTADQQPLWKRTLNSRYSPMKVLSDEQYEDLLKEKLVRVDAEIAIVDEEIGKARARAASEKSHEQQREHKES
ncbi:MAG: hypothetical protein LQ338_006705 [Usnochroma carphineum]|nr:MAG: hypothetical protein LQ338_006705 [Usnochroma carphineum]